MERSELNTCESSNNFFQELEKCHEMVMNDFQSFSYGYKVCDLLLIGGQAAVEDGGQASTEL